MTKYNPKPGEIITIEDFMVCMAHFLLTPVPDYNNKVTVICTDGFRFIINKNETMGQTERPPKVDPVWSQKISDLQTGSLIPTSYMGKLPTSKYRTDYLNCTIVYGKNEKRYYWKADDRVSVLQIVSPADDISDFNGSVVGLNNHKLRGRTPIPGELISIEDVKNILNDTGRTKYAWTYVYFHEWYCTAYQNQPDTWPTWNATSGGPGWMLNRSWYYIRLDTELQDSSGNGILYDLVSSSEWFLKDTYISTYQLQKVLAEMYKANINHNGYETINVRTCHYNCHNSCHSRGKW